MILIVSFEDNDHVEQVRQHLTVESIVLDTSWFPASLGLEAGFAQDAERLCLTLPTGQRIDLARVGAVWYRRARPLSLHADLIDDTARLFAWSEANEALLGLWYSLPCFWMNPPTADEISQRKVRQLQAARSLGLAIPETLITNVPAAALEFIQRHGLGNVVRKAFRNIAEAPRPTILVTETDLRVIDAVRYTPVIFQRFVPAELDLRVTVVENEIFATAIRSLPQYQTDYRIGLASATVFPYELPFDVAAKLLKLMRSLELAYGAIDLRVTPDGEHVFLEVNPGGEYLFISRRTAQPIPAAIAASLQRHDQAAQHAAEARPAGRQPLSLSSTTGSPQLLHTV